MVRRSHRLASHEPEAAEQERDGGGADQERQLAGHLAAHPRDRLPDGDEPGHPPATTTGTTARTEGPSVPVNVSTTVPPCAAGAIVPRKWPPISAGLGWL